MANANIIAMIGFKISVLILPTNVSTEGGITAAASAAAGKNIEFIKILYQAIDTIQEKTKHPPSGGCFAHNNK
ncbi:MAG: hypothetical protein A2494_00720 [Candidatus Lloydbacteria bacterium RIFOXYC12_FULL_46_25]|uniref:Uncharacterized protein n=1 Tax=Candidatus Lloydbacteria bacterium RIFOXYC12_FULL_46_25 TaxID=1798670 RepID=A0A1G2DUN5_9BACT|nr:MAG: hypothetical protein A2494_00720 [Candidatus Lloydbacteria bacterium RIFOXYC12_FULL_46_25]